MHKSCIRIIMCASASLLLCLCAVEIGLGQQLSSGKNLLDVQQAYDKGELKLDEAAELQLNMLKASRVGSEGAQKCAAPAFMFFDQNRADLGAGIQTKIQSFRSERMASNSSLAEERYVSPSGKFEIVYQTSGEDAVSLEDLDNNGVPDYVELVAFASDSSYREEVLNIGYADPIPSGYTYKVNIVNLGFYGYADNAAGPGAPGPLTEIFIDNDFTNFPPNSHPEGDVTGAVYATMAHEFKHAIQYAQNQWALPSGGVNWSEMDATLMEEVVFDDVNDYYNYIKTSFNGSSPYSQSIFFAPENGTPGSYFHVSWMIHFHEYYGKDLFRQVWDLIEQDIFLSIDDALRVLLPGLSQADSFEEAHTRNHLWHFASGIRSGSDSYGFEEKIDYPFANVEQNFTSVPTVEQSVASLEPLSARYYEITPDAEDEGFVEVAVDFDSSLVGVGLLFYLKDGSIQEQIATGENKAQVYMPSELNWEDIDRLGIVVSNPANDNTVRNVILSTGKTGNPITIRDEDYADLPSEVRVYQNYPNPFNPSTRIPFEVPRTSYVKLDIFDITGRKVQTLVEGVYRLGSYTVQFDASGLGSGTYFYRLKIDEAVFTKKMTLIN